MIMHAPHADSAERRHKKYRIRPCIPVPNANRSAIKNVLQLLDLLSKAVDSTSMIMREALQKNLLETQQVLVVPAEKAKEPATLHPRN